MMDHISEAFNALVNESTEGQGNNNSEAAKSAAPNSKETNQYSRVGDGRKQLTEAYKDIEESRRESQELKAAIIKGIQSGEPLEETLDKALKCVSAAVKDDNFYSITRKLLDNH